MQEKWLKPSIPPGWQLKQSINSYTPGTGGTDPGDDPTGNPIPVGDGWYLLAFFGVCYAAFKMRHNIKKPLSYLT
jgi:hypothetical protein